jgi:hypothetical protein
MCEWAEMPIHKQHENHTKTGHELPKTAHNGTKTINFSRASEFRKVVVALGV